MNDDDLEDRLSRWQPADAPADLMRRLRAAKPPRSEWQLPVRFVAEGGWPWKLAGLGLLTALVLVFVVQPRGALRSLEAAKALSAEQTGHRTAASPATFWSVDGASDFSQNDAQPNPGGLGHDPVLDLNDFTRPSLRYAVLGDARGADAADRLALDSPVSLVRLDCGYTPSTGELDSGALGRFRLNADDRF